MNMKEIWKDVQGYEGLYQVSNDGDVISLRLVPYASIAKLVIARNSHKAYANASPNGSPKK